MTFLITVLGLVQGVGYRPFVARLADDLGITGTVQNSGGVVLIRACGSRESLDVFVQDLTRRAPTGASVKQVLTQLSAEDLVFADFQIIASTNNTEITPVLPADLPMCEACRLELFDPRNRRFGYPFISCVDCGPRYSIMKTIPYDRDTITMQNFPMCPACEREYKGDDRRRHAQTISCNDCGPQLILRTGDKELHKEAALSRAVELILGGGVLAIKGVGGYQLACLPDRQDSIRALRTFKIRDRKPFAVMFPNLQAIHAVCRVSAQEEELLCSEARPIVLLTPEKKIFCDDLTGGSRFTGAFLPYTALHQLLTDACGSLVMTSANRSDEPILYRDEDMFGVSSPHLAGILYNTRMIVTPLDDSVARIVAGRTQLIRRSRGFVPGPIPMPATSGHTILAMGGDLKSCFCLYKNDRAYLSQYFGDMDSTAVKQNFKENIIRMQRLFRMQPDIIVSDLHPLYQTGRLADACVTNTDRKWIRIQHHHAHAASVMAEHDLSSCIGVTFDGTGYGTDGAIWGGEIFLCSNDRFERAAHLSYTALCGGDEAARNADLTAFCYLNAAGIRMPHNDGDTLRAVLADGSRTWQTSSMGRLFDAVSSVLGICHVNSYEGECAVLLENAAAEAEAAGIEPYELHFAIHPDREGITADAVRLLGDIYRAAENGCDRRALALGFHKAIVQMTVTLCRRIRDTSGENRVGLSGGVFANTILTEDCIRGLEKVDFEVYINQAVPTNDGGISLGQAWICGQKMKQE